MPKHLLLFIFVSFLSVPPTFAQGAQVPLQVVDIDLTTTNVDTPDHLGNLRLTFSATPETESNTATLETVHEEEEYATFLRYAETTKINSTFFEHTNNGETPFGPSCIKSHRKNKNWFNASAWTFCFFVAFMGTLDYIYLRNIFQPMSRKYKFRDNEKLYFISFAVVYWLDVFIRNDYRYELLDSWKYCMGNKGLEIYGWCIMTSHVHMIMGSNQDKLEGIVKDMKSYTSGRLRKAIQAHPQESRREWMLRIMERAEARTKTTRAFSFGNNTTSLLS